MCGFANCGGSIMPWRAEDLGKLLTTFAEHGERYGGFGSYTGCKRFRADDPVLLPSCL